MSDRTLDRAVQCVEKSMRRDRLTFPKTAPTVRVAFSRDASWQTLALVQAFDLDASIVFEQPLRITDAYFGCFEADFEPADQSETALNLIFDKIRNESEFDDLVVKYNIVKVHLINFPMAPESELEIYFNHPKENKRNSLDEK